MFHSRLSFSPTTFSSGLLICAPCAGSKASMVSRTWGFSSFPVAFRGRGEPIGQVAAIMRGNLKGDNRPCKQNRIKQWEGKVLCGCCGCAPMPLHTFDQGKPQFRCCHEVSGWQGCTWAPAMLTLLSRRQWVKC